jgi:hypothetical protein
MKLRPSDLESLSDIAENVNISITIFGCARGFGIHVLVNVYPYPSKLIIHLYYLLYLFTGII